MTNDGIIMLTRRDVARLLTVEECITAVEHAFRLYGGGRTDTPGVLGIHTPDGGFHIKAGVLPLTRLYLTANATRNIPANPERHNLPAIRLFGEGRTETPGGLSTHTPDGGFPTKPEVLALTRLYFAAKVNGNFPANPERHNLPTIQGVALLADGTNGQPLALMDSMELTALRTAAATAVAAKYLARPDSRVVTICGCGVQGAFQLRALARVLKLDKAYAWDINHEQSAEFARTLTAELGIPVVQPSDLDHALQTSDVCVTCSTSRHWFLGREHMHPGLFIAAVGADHPQKQELDPRLLSEVKVVCDVVEQCTTIGDLHHALDAGLMTRAQVHAELGEVVAGKKPGRISEEEIIVFDSTGMALQDVAAAAAVYEKAVQEGHASKLNFAA